MGIERIEFHTEAFRALLHDDKVVADLTRRGQAIASAAGNGVEVQVRKYRSRPVVIVAADSQEAKKAEATDKVLTTALGAGRG
jgi:hypothetical protein